jgi:hypothetical protein
MFAEKGKSQTIKTNADDVKVIISVISNI